MRNLKGKQVGKQVGNGGNNMTIYRCTNKLCNGYEIAKLEEVEICVGTVEEDALLCSLCDDLTLYDEVYDEEVYLEV